MKNETHYKNKKQFCKDAQLTNILTFCDDGVVPYPTQGLIAIFFIVESEMIARNFISVPLLPAVWNLSVCHVLTNISPCRAWDLRYVTETCLF